MSRRNAFFVAPRTREIKVWLVKWVRNGLIELANLKKFCPIGAN